MLSLWNICLKNLKICLIIKYFLKREKRLNKQLQEKTQHYKVAFLASVCNVHCALYGTQTYIWYMVQTYKIIRGFEDINRSLKFVFVELILTEIPLKYTEFFFSNKESGPLSINKKLKSISALSTIYVHTRTSDSNL